jgi:peptidoglycan/xylan/chitin deacetylase (PgdA/CDA1 family)
MMSKKHISLTVLFLATAFNFFPCPSFSQTYGNNDLADSRQNFVWPEGKKMALSLTFDDARLSQIDTGIPLLDKYGVKATFYISPGSMLERSDKWRMAVNNGHDIGNHSLYHPCSGNFAWSRNRALEEYTLQKMMTELDSASRLIKEILGIQPLSFAYPCGQTFIGRGINVQSYVPLIAIMFESGRGWLNEAPNDPMFCDLSQLNGAELDGKSFEQVLKLIETAKSNGYWLILAGHEMNDEGYQTSQLKTIEEICKYVKDPANEIWIDNVHNVASYINQNRKDYQIQIP